jgi:DNA polymerase III subunit gamma/tau
MTKPPSLDPRAAEYTVLARRYRPQQFADLVGQESVAQALVNALQGGRVAHAYLFTGARGVGKTSTARILAKALNCERGPTPTPCDQCRSCLDVAGGDDIDVLEIDGASNRGIDEVRAIRQQVNVRPSRGRYKVYIIDEVHMLTAPAFNALLKTLEEPPAHVKFIFATTEVQKIPVTILSRCQRFDFGSITVPRIVACLKGVAAGEGKAADEEALHQIARRAGGSMRDAQSLLDQLLAFGGDRLTADQVHQLLGTANDDRVAALAAAVLGKDLPQALRLLNDCVDEGLQLGELLDQLTGWWRDLMLVAAAGPDAPDLAASPAHKPALLEQASSLALDTILAGLDVLDKTRTRLRGSGQGRVLLEMALVRLARLDDLLAVGQLAQWVTNTGTAIATATTAVPQPRSGAAPEPAKKKLTSDAEPHVEATPETALTAQTVAQIWSEVLAQLGQIHAGQIRRAGLPAIIGPNVLALTFPPVYTDAREFCSEPGRQKQMEELLRQRTGQNWMIRLEQASAARVGPEAKGPGRGEPALPRPRVAEAIEKHPLLQRVFERFGLDAQQARLDDGFSLEKSRTSPQPWTGPEEN